MISTLRGSISKTSDAIDYFPKSKLLLLPPFFTNDNKKNSKDEYLSYVVVLEIIFTFRGSTFVHKILEIDPPSVSPLGSSLSYKYDSN